MSLYFPHQYMGPAGFGAVGTPAKGCNPTADRKAADAIARIFGCPDCPGMLELSPTHHFICYWVKRPMGQLMLVAAIGALVYFFVVKKR